VRPEVYNRHRLPPFVLSLGLPNTDLCNDIHVYYAMTLTANQPIISHGRHLWDCKTLVNCLCMYAFAFRMVFQVEGSSGLNDSKPQTATDPYSS
jgi:hypothetical protein